MIIRQTYRIYPNKEQTTILNRWLGQARFVWNYMLNLNIESYKDSGKFIFGYDMNNLLPELKKQEETSWLSEIPAQTLQQKCGDLDKALTQSFKANKSRKGFPKFKSRKTDESGIRFPSFKLNGNRIVLPKMKSGIKIKLHRELLGKKGSVTIIKDKTGCFFASIIVTINDSEIPFPTNEIRNSVGVDLGLKEFAVTSDSEIIENPRLLKKSRKKLLKAQRSHSRKQKGSNNREHSRIRLARVHKKVTNQRKDFINQIAYSIAKNNDLIAVESLNVSGMMKNHKLAKSIADVSWSAFINTLSWQAKKRGKYLVQIDTWFPSSKACSCCGNKKELLNLSERVYNCNSCGISIDRDLNAARNILKEGTNMFYNTVGTTGIYVCGYMNSEVGNSAQEILN